MKRSRQLVTTPVQMGAILRGRRKARGISQPELAAKLSIGQSRLSELEASPARLTLDRLLALANLLGLQIVVEDRPDAASSPPPKVEW